MSSWNWLAAEQPLLKHVEQNSNNIVQITPAGPLAPLTSITKLVRTPVRDSPLAFGLNGLTSGSSPVIAGIYSKRSTRFCVVLFGR
jgi:hypothetical protein